MSEHSLEWNCEELLMRMLRPDDRFEGVEFFHHDKTTQAQLDCLVFKAVRREQQLEAVKGTEVVVSITYATGTATPELSDKLAAAMVECAYKLNPDSDLKLPDFEFVSVEPNANTRREDLKKSRKRVVQIPLIGKLVDS